MGESGHFRPKPTTSITRRQVLGGAVALTLAAARSRVVRASTSAAAAPDWKGGRPNVILLWTDQERQFQHWPAGWVERHLPSQARLRRHGLTFARAFTGAAQCTPSRATFMTSTYPAVNGVTNTLASPLLPLETRQQNLARLMGEAGYAVAYKGKWHLSLPVRVGPPAIFDVNGGGWSSEDIEQHARAYGVPGWNPPDAGTTEFAILTLGGGRPNNDGRIVSGVTPGAVGQTQGFGESAIEFLESWARSDRSRPFCLFVSLVNPHDVSIFPRMFREAGYERQDFVGLGIVLPSNFEDSLADKPRIQRLFRDYFARPDQGGPLDTRDERLAYVNFYAYLHTVVDRHIVALLDSLDALGLTDDTLILRFSDHGEQGLSHGLRQKMFTAYEETIHVPLIVSNPRMFPEPLETESFASLLDLLPTVAALGGMDPEPLRAQGVRGRDLGPVLRDPARSVQDSVLFTYDDWFGTGFEKEISGVPTHIRCVRQGSMVYAVYFTGSGSSFDYELYDLDADPGQRRNLARDASASVAKERARLHALLTRKLEEGRALPGSFDWSRAAPDRS